LIKIEIPTPDVIIIKQPNLGKYNEPNISSVYGFVEYKLIPNNVAGIYMFFDENDELLYCGKADNLRQRIIRHFQDSVSSIRYHRDEVYKIAVFYVEDPLEREIYETYIINKLQAKYNIDKIFFR
jgi:excinuclease UvrABC nuclease subunit